MAIHPILKLKTFYLKNKNINLMVPLEERSEEVSRLGPLGGINVCTKFLGFLTFCLSEQLSDISCPDRG